MNIKKSPGISIYGTIYSKLLLPPRKDWLGLISCKYQGIDSYSKINDRRVKDQHGSNYIYPYLHTVAHLIPQISPYVGDMNKFSYMILKIWYL